MIWNASGCCCFGGDCSDLIARLCWNQEDINTVYILLAEIYEGDYDDVGVKDLTNCWCGVAVIDVMVKLE